MHAPFTSIVLAGALLGAGTASAAPALDIRPGLWTFNETSTTTGDIMSPETKAMLATLTPAQRASITAAMAKMASDGAKGEQRQICLTPDKLQLDRFGDTLLGLGMGCRTTIVSGSPRRLEQTMVCQSGDMHSLHAIIETSGREALSGTGDGAYGASGRITAHFTARFVGPTCPAAPR